MLCQMVRTVTEDSMKVYCVKWYVQSLRTAWKSIVSNGMYSHWGQHESLLWRKHCTECTNRTETRPRYWTRLTYYAHNDCDHARRQQPDNNQSGNNDAVSCSLSTELQQSSMEQNTQNTDSNCCWVELGAVNQELVQIQYVESQEICAETAIKSYAADRQARSYGCCYYTLSQDTILLSATLPNAKRFLKIFHC